MSEEYSKKIVDFPDLREAWTCGNCKYFILREEKNPNMGECHESPPIPVTIDAMIIQGKMAPSPLSPEMIECYKCVPQITWMFARTSKILVGCSKFRVIEKAN